MRLQETPDHVTVLLGLEAAGGIEDPSAGPDPKGRVIEKCDLDLRQALEFSWVEPPPQLHPSAQHAGVRAGSVHEDAVELWNGSRQGGDCRDAGGSEAECVLTEKGQSTLGGVVRDDPPRIPKALCGVEGLAARCGTEVEDGFAWTRIEFPDRQKGAGVLDVESSVQETPETGEGGAPRQFVDGTGFDPVEAPFLVVDPFGIPSAEDLLRGGLQPVDPGEERRGRVDPTAERLEFVWAVPARPSGDEPRGE